MYKEMVSTEEKTLTRNFKNLRINVVDNEAPDDMVCHCPTYFNTENQVSCQINFLMKFTHTLINMNGGITFVQLLEQIARFISDQETVLIGTYQLLITSALILLISFLLEIFVASLQKLASFLIEKYVVTSKSFLIKVQRRIQNPVKI